MKRMKEPQTMRPSLIPATSNCGRLLRLAGFAVLSIALHLIGI
jgi:hypothetical protein